MKRIASLFLPALSIERLRLGRSAPPPPPEPPAEPRCWPRQRARPGAAFVSDPIRAGECSCPRGDGWRPGARWAQREAAAFPSFRRSAGFAAVPPVATTHRVGSRVLLAAVSNEAAALGLAPGMAATHARMLVPGLELHESDPDADSALLLRLARLAARRWTPTAAVAPDGLWLDLGGATHLFGGEQALCEHILRLCARSGFTARIAVAGTAGAAHALARFSPGPITLCPSGGEAQAIAPLPPAALRLDQAALSAARRFGIALIGDLLAMPRGPLRRRFGDRLLTRLDQAVGRLGEPLEPVIPSEPPAARLRLAEPIATAEAIAQVARDLTSILARRLGRRGLGARRIALLCERVGAEDQTLEVGLAAATRDPGHLAALLAMRIEAIEPGFGIEAMALTAVRFEPLAPAQIGGSEGEAGLPPLIDRIAGRIGAGRIFRMGARESDVPERSVKILGPLDLPEPWPDEWPRPVRLLARPEPVDKVIAELPDQPPLRFCWRGRTYRVCRADGPERIFGEWWRRSGEADSVRDYFQVEDEAGGRFWLFRRGDGCDPRTGDLSWWMHGLFA